MTIIQSSNHIDGAHWLLGGGGNEQQLHNTRYYSCPRLCGRRFKYEHRLKLHLTGGCDELLKFECYICKKKLTTKVNLRTHLGLVHKVLMDVDHYLWYDDICDAWWCMIKHDKLYDINMMDDCCCCFFPVY